MGTNKKQMRSWGRIVVLAGGLALATHLTPAHASIADFELPPSPSETAEPQGPVAPGILPPRVARPQPSPTPTVAPLPEPFPTLAPTAPESAAPAPPQRSGTAPGSPETVGIVGNRAAGSNQPASTAATTVTTDAPEPLSTGAEITRPELYSTSAPEVPPGAEASRPDDHWVLRIPKWLPAALAGAALVIILSVAAWYRLRRRKTSQFFAPTLERPHVQPNAGAAPKARPPASPGMTEPPAPTFGTIEPDEPLVEEEETLSLAIEARQLSISLMAATLSYRITLTNSGKAPVRGVAIAGDMISAHASRSTEEQMATASSELARCHDIADIPAGKSVQVVGEFRLPLPMIQPIRRGDLALFVPLARLRVEATQGADGAIVKTALIGQRSPRPGAGLQPFRLDLGPRVYREVTQKIFS